MAAHRFGWPAAGPSARRIEGGMIPAGILRKVEMETCTPAWRQRLLRRLERDMGREMVDADLACIAWNDAAGTLTVQSAPLLAELKARNLISNVFRCRDFKH